MEHLREHQAGSERRACRVLGADRTATRYRWALVR